MTAPIGAYYGAMIDLNKSKKGNIMSGNDFRGSGYALTQPEAALRAGMLVNYYVNPEHTIGNELSGRLTAVLIGTNDGIGSGSENVLVCPVVSASGKKLDFTGPAPIGDPMFRPDLSTFLCKNILDPVCKPNGKVAVLGESFVQQLRAGFLKVIKATSAEDASARFIGKGMMAWFNSIPHVQDPSKTAEVPAVSLTPVALAERTGMALVCRGYTDVLTQQPLFCTSVLEGVPKYKPTYLHSNTITAVSIKRFKHSNRSYPIKLLPSTLQDLVEKISARVDDSLFETLKERHAGQERGFISPNVQRALADCQISGLSKRKFSKDFV